MKVRTVSAEELAIVPGGEWPASIDFEGNRYSSPEFFRSHGLLLHVTYYRHLSKVVVTVN